MYQNKIHFMSHIEHFQTLMQYNKILQLNTAEKMSIWFGLWKIRKKEVLAYETTVVYQ